MENEIGRDTDETAHLVTLTRDYWMGIFEFTQGQYETVSGLREIYPFFTNNACYATRPLEGYGPRLMYNTGSIAPEGGTDAVSQGTIIYYVRQKTGGLKLTLPTEAQWEYACRAGVGNALSSGKDLKHPHDDPAADELGRNNNNMGTNDDSSPSAPLRAADDSVGTAKVGSYPANPWGLYDMHSNVAEYCLDEYGEYEGDMETVQTNPCGPKAGTGTGNMVLRGGNWVWKTNVREAACCRSAERRSVGFRWNTSEFRGNGLRLCLGIE
jgi:formylglycine-generating enzyme required for sulfatase activity